MAYFRELPFIQYPLRFENQSSNQDFTLVRNIFRRAKIQERIANYVTAFTYYQITENERPDQIADRIYGDSELDWVILIVNNITNYQSKWPLGNNIFYEYLINKYGSEENLNSLKFLETEEVRDEFDRLVVPASLQVDSDFYQEFTTVSNKANPLFYDLNHYPIPSKYYDLKITINLGQYYEIWERDNLEENQNYIGEIYNVSEVFLRKPENPEVYQITNKIYPDYTRLDFSYLNVYGRNEEIKSIFNPITLKGWPYTWGGKALIYNRDGNITEVELKSSVNSPIDITDETRLFVISFIQIIDTFEYTEGTVLINEANKTYTVSNLSSTLDGTNASFIVKRNDEGIIISIELLNKGSEYVPSEVITIPGSKIGGEDYKDDVKITIKTLTDRPEFRFISIGDTLNVPYPGVKVTTSNKMVLSYLSAYTAKVDITNKKEITNYEYEVNLNDKMGQILILKPEYLGAFITELKNIMLYDTSSDTITERIKQVSNPRIIGQ